MKLTVVVRRVVIRASFILRETCKPGRCLTGPEDNGQIRAFELHGPPWLAHEPLADPEASSN